MARKKWTAKTEAEITGTLLKFREKKKWQLAFRRYVIEGIPSESYAPFFGMDINNYKKWIELQLTHGLSWDNFGTRWQFYHIIPVAYFDFSSKEDLVLCWNFINIRVEELEAGKAIGNRIDLLSALYYFKSLYSQTGYSLCIKMLNKIEKITTSGKGSEPALENFIIEHKDQLEKMTLLSTDEFSRLNKGMPLEDIFLEREILRKFG